MAKQSNKKSSKLQNATVKKPKVDAMIVNEGVTSTMQVDLNEQQQVNDVEDAIIEISDANIDDVLASVEQIESIDQDPTIEILDVDASEPESVEQVEQVVEVVEEGMKIDDLETEAPVEPVAQATEIVELVEPAKSQDEIFEILDLSDDATDLNFNEPVVEVEPVVQLKPRNVMPTIATQPPTAPQPKKDFASLFGAFKATGGTPVADLIKAKAPKQPKEPKVATNIMQPVAVAVPDDCVKISTVGWRNTTGKKVDYAGVDEATFISQGKHVLYNRLQEKSTDSTRSAICHLTNILYDVMGVEHENAMINGSKSAWAIITSQSVDDIMAQMSTPENLRKAALLKDLGYGFNPATKSAFYYYNTRNIENLANNYSLEEKQAMYNAILEASLKSHSINPHNNQFTVSIYQTNSFLLSLNETFIMEYQYRIENATDEVIEEVAVEEPATV